MSDDRANVPQATDHTPLIAPSILAADFSNLQGELHRIETGGADWVHLDVMDGHFVPNLTFGPPVIKALRAHSALPFDVHLMIERPDLSLEDYRRAGADGITVHVEACVHLHRTLTQIKQLGARVGVSLNPHTPLAMIEEVLDEVDMILVMSVNPGFGGQSFIPKTLDKISRLRSMVAARDNRPLIQVDGGVKRENIKLIASAGADVFVAGSAIFGAADPSQAIAELKREAVQGVCERERV